jgi:hypothetical protein
MANKIISELNEELWPQSQDLFVVHGSGLTKKVKLHHMMPDFYSSDTIYLNYDPSTRIFFSHLKENSVKSYHIFPLSAFEVIGSDKGIEHWLAQVYSNSLQISELSSEHLALNQFVLTNSPFWAEAYNISTVYASASSRYEEVYTNVVSNSTAYLSAVDLSFLSVSGDWNTAYNTATDYAAISANFLTSETDSQTLSFDEVTKDLSISNGNTVSLSALIDGTSVDTGIRALTANWQSTYTIVQGNSATISDVTSDVTVGSINAGDVVLKGTNLQNFVEQLLLKTFYPTFTNPSASMSSNLASTVESGTTSVTLTVTLNRGAITGKSIGGIWQPSTFQDFRSGVATNYIINGINNGTTNSLVSSTAIIKDGSNSFSSTTSYDQGPQPVDSKNINYSTPLVAGTANAITNVTGARRGFYGVDSLADTSALIRSLGSNTNPGVSNGTNFTINIPAGATSVIFAYPSTLQNVTTVKYVEGLNAEVKTNFTQTTVLVEGLNGYTAINYKVYRYVPVQPFPSSATYTVTI